MNHPHSQLTERPNSVVAVAIQMTALDCDQRPATDLQVDLERASTEYRLRRGVRELGRLRQPQNVLEFLAVAKQRGHEINLRVFK